MIVQKTSVFPASRMALVAASLFPELSCVIVRAPVLMLSSKHDEVWPSFESASCMEKTLTEIGSPYPHKHIAYEHMSHAVLTKLP